MTQIVGSLFGISPEQLQTQRDANLWHQAAGFAQMAPMEQAVAGSFVAGNKLAGGMAGLMGAQDPELQRMAQRQALVQGLDWSNPETIKAAAAKAAQNGDTAAALELIKRADDVAQTVLDRGVKQSQIVKNLREKQSMSVEEQVFKTLASKASPESVKRAMENGNDISLLDVPDNVKISEFGRQLLESGLTIDSKEFKEKMGKFVNAKIDGAAKGNGNVSVTIGSSTIDGKKTAEAAGKVVGEALAGIEEKYSAIDSVRDATKMLDEGIFSGMWGKTKMNLHKAFGENHPKVVNTEKFLSHVGEIVIPRLKDFGGNDSNEEMKYLQKVLAGEQSLESKTMKDVLASAEKKIQRGIERLQRQSKAAGTGGAAPLDPGPSREADKPRSFTSVQEAEAAKLPKGTQIIINGRKAVVE